MITLVHGPEEYLRAEHVATARAALGSAELADLSTTRLDGRKTALSEITYYCDVVPFLTPHRLVIVDGLLEYLYRRRQSSVAGTSRATSRSKSPGATADEEQEALLAYLPRLPETTELVLVETIMVPAKNRVMKALAGLAGEGRATIHPCQAPGPHELARWITGRARSKGAQIEPAAARDLATFVGPHLRLLDSELEKLAAYRGGEGPIRAEDVRLLVPYAQEANIFDMVDAIGRRDGATALRLLRELQRDGAAPLYLLSMIGRQFRILVQVTDQMARGKDKHAIAKAIGLHPYPTGKAMTQSRRWPQGDLQRAYDRLLETDLSIKTGRLPDSLALDLLVVELSQRVG